MSNAEELKKDSQEKLKQLQANCKHESVGGWTKSDFLSGIPTIEFKKCNTCSKIIARRTKCWACGSWVEEPNWIQGDGSEKMPIGTVFCCETHKRLYAQTARALGREVPPWIGIGINTK